MAGRRSSSTLTIPGGNKKRILSLRSKICDDHACRFYDEKMHLPIFKDQMHCNPAWIAANGDIFASLGN
jgi:hypothetical protein